MHDELAKRFRGCATLGDAIVIGLAQRPVWSVVDVIHQDEYTLDIVMVADGAPDGPAIVLDST